MHYVYLLELNSHKYYAGSTSDLKSRIKYHESGKVISTKDKGPIKLVWYAAFETKRLALDFEIYSNHPPDSPFEINGLLNKITLSETVFFLFTAEFFTCFRIEIDSEL